MIDMAAPAPAPGNGIHPAAAAAPTSEEQLRPAGGIRGKLLAALGAFFTPRQYVRSGVYLPLVRIDGGE